MADAESASYHVVTKAEEPNDEWPAWVLGKKYCLPRDEKLMQDRIRSCLWFSYRKHFRVIGSSGLTSDSGWGCTMRCGQMLLAEALIRHHLPDWHWQEGSCDNVSYNWILKQFLDLPDSVYSIQQIAQFGVDYGKKIGDWFGPNNMCQVIKKLTAYDPWSDLTVHVAMDLTVIKEEVRQTACTQRPHSGSGFGSLPLGLVSLCGRTLQQPAESSVDATSSPSTFRPVLVLIPLRLGLDQFEMQYSQPLLSCFSLPQSVGLIGGKPRHALWFVGHKDNRLVYLDPHTTQPSLQLTEFGRIPDSTYHKEASGHMRFNELDPSMAVGFLCKSEEDMEDLFHRLKQDVCQTGPSMFEVMESRPTDMDCLLLESRVEDSIDEFIASPTAAEMMADEEYDIVELNEVSHSVAMDAMAASRTNSASASGASQSATTEEVDAGNPHYELFSLLA